MLAYIFVGRVSPLPPTADPKAHEMGTINSNFRFSSPHLAHSALLMMTTILNVHLSNISSHADHRFGS
jgi:hypothetical protein